MLNKTTCFQILQKLTFIQCLFNNKNYKYDLMKMCSSYKGYCFYYVFIFLGETSKYYIWGNKEKNQKNFGKKHCLQNCLSIYVQLLITYTIRITLLDSKCWTPCSVCRLPFLHLILILCLRTHVHCRSSRSRINQRFCIKYLSYLWWI